MRFFSYIRSYVQWFLFGVLLLLTVFLILLFARFFSPTQLEKFLQKFTAAMVWISGIDLHIHGEENIDRTKSYVVMFNHFNFFDHFVIFHALKLKLRGLEKEAHFSWPVYGKFMQQIGIIPIPPRGNTEKAMQALNIAKSKIKEGFSMLIAPEGTRTVDGTLGTFKKGGFYMAIQTQADILPVIFKGMYKFNKKGSKLLTPCRVDLFIEKPISTLGLTETDATALRNQIRNLYDKAS